jgi:hypothetical protein
MSDDDSERPRRPARRAYWFRPVDDDGVVDIAAARAESRVAEALIMLLVVAYQHDRGTFDAALRRLRARASLRLQIANDIAALIRRRAMRDE